MPTLEPVGRVADPETLQIEPVIIPIVGYNADREEVIYEASFRGMQPLGESLDMMAKTDANGNVAGRYLFAFLEACVTEDQRDEWHEWLHSSEVFVEQTTLVSVYEVLTEYYTDRPTPQRSVSHNGRVTSGRTSRAAAPSKASTSKSSRAGKASTS